MVFVMDLYPLTDRISDAIASPRKRGEVSERRRCLTERSAILSVELLATCSAHQRRRMPQDCGCSCVLRISRSDNFVA